LECKDDGLIYTGVKYHEKLGRGHFLVIAMRLDQQGWREKKKREEVQDVRYALSRMVIYTFRGRRQVYAANGKSAKGLAPQL